VKFNYTDLKSFYNFILVNDNLETFYIKNVIKFFDLDSSSLKIAKPLLGQLST
jgi:catalase